MSTINYAQKEISCKIVYYGPGLGGKTTNLQHVHHSLPERNRGELVSLATQQDRTLFFDFLPMDLGKVKGFDTKFHLYTVPGQVYYNATRKLVLRGVDGIVFVADSQKDRMEENLKSLDNLRENLEEYGYEMDDIPWVMQYNKRDLDNIAEVEELERRLNPDGAPFFEGVAITGEGVIETLKKISGMVLGKLKAVAEAAHDKKKTTLSDLAAQEQIIDQNVAPPPDMFHKSRLTAKEPAPEGRKELSESDIMREYLPLTAECSMFLYGIEI
mgnify:FL=1